MNVFKISLDIQQTSAYSLIEHVQMTIVAVTIWVASTLQRNGRQAIELVSDKFGLVLGAFFESVCLQPIAPTRKREAHPPLA